MSDKLFKAAIRQIEGAADKLTIASGDTATYTDERSQEMLRRAARVLRQVRLALECGRAYKVTGAAEEFDHAVQMDGAGPMSEQPVCTGIDHFKSDVQLCKALDCPVHGNRNRFVLGGEG